MKKDYSIGAIFISLAYIISMAGLTGCGSGSNSGSIVGDGVQTKDKPMSQVDTSAKGNGTYLGGSEMDSSNVNGSPQSGRTDARFLADAYQGGLMEVELGRIAQSKSQNPQVRTFGAMMIRDHGQGENALKTLATSKLLTLPDSISDRQKRERDQLLNESNVSFDKDYINAMVKDHKDDIAEFEGESINGKDSTIKSFATQTLNMLHRHLDRAGQLQQKMY